MRMRYFEFAWAVLLSGCTVGPDYVRPDLDLPKTFRFEEREARDLANTAWWNQFRDPVLAELIRIALVENKDLRIATARIEEFAGRFRSTRADLFPQIGYSVSATGLRSSEVGPVPLTPGVDNPESVYDSLFTVTWELDVWGRIRRLSEAARAELLASEEGRRGVILTLVSGVAGGYVNLRDLDKQLAISHRTVKTREEALRLFERRFKGGVVSEVELAQVRSEYEAALATIPQIETAIAQNENALSVLLGRDPGPIRRARSIDEMALPQVPAGLPSELLARRPDLRQAEQNLIAANARIGAARALYYPRIALTTLLGFSSVELSDLFIGPAHTWQFAGSLVGPIFTAGAIEGTVEQAESQQQQLLVAYERAIQNAFREVDDALIGHRKSRERLASQARQIDALRHYARLARLRFEGGYTSYLEVLDAERSLFNAELSHAQTQNDVIQALINTYKAMGGGWVTEADTLAGGPPRPMDVPQR
ncbi:MAG: efflux transporter outer membrane subunit [Gammaproteobacteria bacterium]